MGHGPSSRVLPILFRPIADARVFVLVVTSVAVTFVAEVAFALQVRIASRRTRRVALLLTDVSLPLTDVPFLLTDVLFSFIGAVTILAGLVIHRKPPRAGHANWAHSTVSREVPGRESSVQRR